MNLKTTLVLLILFLISTKVYCSQYITADTLIQFDAGTGQNSGQDPKYFPNNVFGYPSRFATKYTPETKEEQICSFGMNGEIILSFKDYIIVDKPGNDFYIYENAFVNPINKRYFAEPGVVSVSEDGINFVQFPFDSLTLDGCAGTLPTTGDNLDYNPEKYGGNGFDLATLNLAQIKYIKIKDITHILIENKKHPFYDISLSGFDLDAIVGVNFELDNSIPESKFIEEISKFDNKIINKDYISIYLKMLESYKFEIFDYTGYKIDKSIIPSNSLINNQLSILLIKIEFSNHKIITLKIMVN